MTTYFYFLDLLTWLAAGFSVANFLLLIWLHHRLKIFDRKEGKFLDVIREFAFKSSPILTEPAQIEQIKKGGWPKGKKRKKSIETNEGK